MQKKFLKNLALVLILNFLVKPFYILGIDAEMLKQIEEHSPGDYGIYFSLLNLSFILNIFLDLGINNYNTRNIARNSQLLKKHFSGILSVRLLLSFAYLVLLIIAALILGYQSRHLQLLVILGFNQILIAFIMYFRSNLAGLHLFKEDSIISVIDRALLVVFCSLMLWGGIRTEPIKIEWFILAQTAAYACTFIIAGGLIYQRTQSFRLKIKPAFSVMIMKKSLPYALLILLMTVYYRSDSIMIERMMPKGAVEAANYARGFRFFEALNMVGFLFAGLLLPIFAKQLKQRQSTNELLGLSLKLMMSFALISAVAFFVFSREIIEWRYAVSGQELTDSASAFALLMVCLIFIAASYIFSTLLTANGNMGHLNKIAAAGVLLNIGLNLFFIPTYGIVGAAFASLITQVLSAVTQIILSYVQVKIRIERKIYLQLLGFTILFLPLAYGIKVYTPLWYIGLAGILLAGLILSMLSGLTSLREMKQILKSEA